MFNLHLWFYFLCEKVKSHALMNPFLHCTYVPLGAIHSSGHDLLPRMLATVSTMGVIRVLSLLIEVLNLAQVFLAYFRMFFQLFTVVRWQNRFTVQNEPFGKNKPDASLCIVWKYSWAMPWGRVTEQRKSSCLLPEFFHLFLPGWGLSRRVTLRLWENSASWFWS